MDINNNPVIRFLEWLSEHFMLAAIGCLWAALLFALVRMWLEGRWV